MTTAYDPRHIRSADYTRLYPSASETAGVPIKWDIAITYGSDGEEWTLEVNGQSVAITAQALDTANDVAGDLRTAAAALVGVTVTGATNHVILEVAGPASQDDPLPAEPVLTSDDDGSSTISVVSASNASGFGVTTVDQK